MTWGLGTGFCGTHLLAQTMKGLHQPEPTLVKMAPHYFRYGRSDDEHLHDALAKLRDLDTPIVVSHKYSLVIPAIFTVDLNAKFIWLLRDPAENMRSDLRKKMYGRKSSDEWTQNRVVPKGGFPSYFNNLDKSIWRYTAINEKIEKDLFFICEDDWYLQESEELEGWSPPDHEDPFGYGDLALVERQLRSLYVNLIATHGTRKTATKTEA